MDTTNVAALAVLLARQKPDYGPVQCAEDAKRLTRLSASIRRLDEAACNRELSSREEKRRETLIKSVRALLAPYHVLSIVHNSDPRGYAIKLLFPAGEGSTYPSNTWGGAEDGWGF